MTGLKAALNERFILGSHIKCRSGWMWNIKNKENRIIKVTQDDSDPFLIEEFNNLIRYLKDIDSPSVVKIYEFGELNLPNKSPYHYHVMEKLIPLPRNKDLPIFEEILRDFYYHKRSEPWFCSDEVKVFLRRIKKIKLKYNDLHCKNIMLDRNGKMKLIDLESFLKNRRIVKCVIPS